MTKHEDTMFLKAIFLLPMLLGYGDALAEWRVRIFDRLEPDQVSETAPITIGGVAQTISISNTTPSAYAEFNCPNGRWPYSLQTRTGYYNQQGKLVFVRESLFLRKLVLGIPAQASGKNLTRPPMPSAARIRPRFATMHNSPPVRCASRLPK